MDVSLRGVSVDQWSKALDLELRPVPTDVTWYRVGTPLYTLHARNLGPTSSNFVYLGFKAQISILILTRVSSNPPRSSRRGCETKLFAFEMSLARVNSVC